MSRFSREFEILDISQSCRPPWPVTGVALIYLSSTVYVRNILFPMILKIYCVFSDSLQTLVGIHVNYLYRCHTVMKTECDCKFT
jgi:hypothetical protein